MIRPRAFIGLALLCAAALCAFAAPSASASGTTAFTCKKVAAGVSSTFEDEHCTKAKVGTGQWVHEAIPVNTATEITASNEKTSADTAKAVPSILRSTTFGLELELSSDSVSVTGTLTNKTVTPEGEMFIHGTKIVITYKNVKVTKPAVFCKVKDIVTEPLTATTAGKGNEIEFKPETAGGIFASVILEGCENKALNKTYKLTGSVRAQTSGATITTTHAKTTADKTLFFEGQQAGIEGSLTLRMKGGEPIAPTT